MWSGEKGESEPEWVKSEREEFHNKRDTNKDGKLDVQEVYNWIFPSVDDPIKTEADHLMQEVDVDGVSTTLRLFVIVQHDLSLDYCLS